MDVEAPGGGSGNVLKKLLVGQGSHNKSIGCSASGACAPGPDDEEEEVFTFIQSLGH
jgi:hypothetical protein